jgi:hypothetical protein
MATLALAPSAFAISAAAQSYLERGDYLVNAVMACDGCHTPRGPTGFVMEKRFSGGSQTWEDPAYTVKGSNITPDPDTGIGRWSESDIKISLTEGLRPYGMPVATQNKITQSGALSFVVGFSMIYSHRQFWAKARDHCGFLSGMSSRPFGRPTDASW